MTTKHQMQFVKDLQNKKITVTRHFDGTADQVWKAWTEKELLDRWWAPRPWKTETEAMNFRNGGNWLYAMVGPDNTRHWCTSEYSAIHPREGFKSLAMFCDENGNKNYDFPAMHWDNKFQPMPDGTKMSIEITFDKDADISKILEMGFEEGFTSALGNLDELLREQVGRS